MLKSVFLKFSVALILLNVLDFFTTLLRYTKKVRLFLLDAIEKVRQRSG